MPVLALFTLSLAALLAGLVVGALLNRTAFERRVDAEVAELFTEIETMPTYYSESELDGLPAPVQQFFRRNLHDGVPHQSCVRTREAGRLRQRHGQPWTEFVGEEYVVASTPALLWFGRLRPFPLVWVDSRTLYLRGRAHLLTKLFSSVTSGDSRDDAARRATLVQYLSELPLLPGALLPGDDRRWEGVDAHAARLFVRDGELEVSGLFRFDEFGNITQFESEDRPYLGPQTPTVARWVVRYSEHRSFAELELPTKVDLEWLLDEQPFHYVEKTIEAIELDIPRRWGASEKPHRWGASEQPR